MKKLTHQGIEDLIPYPPGKPIEELERELGITGSIKLASNENPLGPSPLAMKKIMDIAPTLNRYPDGSGYHLKNMLSKKFGFPSEQIVLGNGSNEIIELIIRTFLSPEEDVVQAFPTFLVYEKIVKGAGARMISVPLSNFRIDLNRMADAITPATKVVFICNPNNPTGSVLSMDEVRDFLDRIPEDIIVALDEAYIEFVSDEKAANGLDLLPAYPLLFVLRTFSKLYGLAGLRIGYGFASEKLINYINRVRQPFNAGTLAQAAATAALEDEEFVSRTLKLVGEGLRYLYHELDGMGLEYISTQANFFLIHIPEGGKEVFERLLKQGVIVRAMDAYGLPDYIRINVGLPEENERFIKTLKKVLP